MPAHDVFLSYNRRDHAAAEAVARALRDRGLRVFLDRWEQVPGRPWPEALEAAVGDCAAVAVLLGPNGVGGWQQREKDLALARQAGDHEFPVIPVLLPGAEPALGFLGLNTWVDLRNGADEALGLSILAGAVRGQAPGPDLQDRLRATLAAICPYRGLRPFREEDAPFFFGRETFADRLVEAVGRRALVAVVGPSGSGKSSVVAAGLVPRLRETHGETVWEIAALRPGDRPLRALAAALLPLLEPDMTEASRLEEIERVGRAFAGGGVRLRDVAGRALEKQNGTDRLLLVVDQWEELYTLCDDDDARRRFVEQLLEATAKCPLTVVLTLRGDFYGHALRSREMADRLEGAVVNLGPMTREELERSVGKPAEKVGLRFQDGLVRRILDDVSTEPGNLPLLEFVLTGLWEKRGGGELLHDAYDAMGGAQGAIARRADEEFGRLSALEQDELRRVFGRLVRPGEGTEDTRRRATVAEVGEAASPLVRRLADARLLVTARDPATGAETVEVAHEALIRKWTLLQGWLGEDREFLLWRQRLGAALGERERLPDDPDTLLEGARLSEAERWLRDRPRDLTERERQFIHDSVARRESGRRRRQVRLAAGFAATLVLLSLTTWQWLAARAQATRTLAQKLAAEARLYQDSQPELALLLAAEGASRDPTPETTGALLGVLQRHPMIPAPLPDDDARRAAFEAKSESPAAVTIVDGRVVDGEGRPFPDAGHQLAARAVATSPDGRTLAVGQDDGEIRLWDVAARSQLGGPLLGHDAAVTALAFTADGAQLVSRDEAGAVLGWPVGRATWTERACRMAGRDHEGELAKYLPDATSSSECASRHASGAEGQPGSGPVPHDMVRVPAGWFWMGCNEKVDNTCAAGETGRRVYVGDFAIDRTEVTVAQYRACRESGGCKCTDRSGYGKKCADKDRCKEEPDTGGFCNWGAEGRDQHPINCVDWCQAEQYCAWLGKRLPREEEWEKAARGTDGRKYPWGNDEFGETSKRWANVADEDGKREVPAIPFIAEGYHDRFATTAPVGSFPDGASPYGAQDMSGNVWEWVWDKTTGGRGLRGGSWRLQPILARASGRYSYAPGVRFDDVGFRCAQ